MRPNTLEAIDDNYQLAMSFEKSNVSLTKKGKFDRDASKHDEQHSMIDLSSLSSKDHHAAACDRNYSDAPVNQSMAASSSKMSMKSKIQDKQSKQKFEFIYYKSVFRHFCSYFKSMYLDYTENKKVRQNKLKEVSE